MKICRLAWDFPENGKPTYGLQPVFYYLSREQAVGEIGEAVIRMLQDNNLNRESDSPYDE